MKNRGKKKMQFQSKEKLNITVISGRKKRGGMDIRAKNLVHNGIRFVFLRRKTLRTHQSVVVEYKCQIKNNNRKGLKCNAIIKERQNDGYCLICGVHDEQCYSKTEDVEPKESLKIPYPSTFPIMVQPGSYPNRMEQNKPMSMLGKGMMNTSIPPPPPAPTRMPPTDQTPSQLGGHPFSFPVRLYPQKGNVMMSNNFTTPMVGSRNPSQRLPPPNQRIPNQRMPPPNQRIPAPNHQRLPPPNQILSPPNQRNLSGRNSTGMINLSYSMNKSPLFVRNNNRPSSAVLNQFMIIGAQPTYIHQLGVTTTKIYLHFPSGLHPPRNPSHVTIELRNRFGKTERIPQNFNYIPFMRFNDKTIGDQWAYFAANSEILVTFPLEFGLSGLLDLHLSVVTGNGTNLEDVKNGMFVVEKGFNSDGGVPRKKRKRGDERSRENSEEIFGILPNRGSSNGGDYVELYFSSSLENIYVMNREQDFTVNFGDSSAHIVCIKVRDSSLRSRYAEDFKVEYEMCKYAEYMALVISPPHEPGLVDVSITSTRMSKTIVKNRCYHYSDDGFFRDFEKVNRSVQIKEEEDEDEEEVQQSSFDHLFRGGGSTSNIMFPTGFEVDYNDDIDPDLYSNSPHQSEPDRFEEVEGEERVVEQQHILFRSSPSQTSSNTNPSASTTITSQRKGHIFKFLKSKRDPVDTEDLKHEEKKDMMGWNLLFHSVANGMFLLVRKLIEVYGYDPTKRDYFGSTPLDVAVIFKYGEIVRFLKLYSTPLSSSTSDNRVVFLGSLSVKYSTSSKKAAIKWRKMNQYSVVEIIQQTDSKQYEVFVQEGEKKKISFELNENTRILKENEKLGLLVLKDGEESDRILRLKFEMKEDFLTFRDHIKTVFNELRKKRRSNKSSSTKKRGSEDSSSDTFYDGEKWDWNDIVKFLKNTLREVDGKAKSLYTEMKSKKLIKPIKKILSEKKKKIQHELREEEEEEEEEEQEEQEEEELEGEKEDVDDDNDNYEEEELVVDELELLQRELSDCDSELSMILMMKNRHNNGEDLHYYLSKRIHLLMVSRERRISNSFQIAQKKMFDGVMMNRVLLGKKKGGRRLYWRRTLQPRKKSFQGSRIGQVLRSSEDTLRIEHQEYWVSEMLGLKMLVLLLYKKEMEGVCQMMKEKFEKVYRNTDYDSFSQVEGFRIENVCYSTWFRKNEKKIQELVDLENRERSERERMSGNNNKKKEKIEKCMRLRKCISEEIGLDYRVFCNLSDVDLFKYVKILFYSSPRYMNEVRKMIDQKLERLVFIHGKSHKIRYPLEYVVSGRFDDKNCDFYHMLRMNNMMIMLSKRNDGFVEVCDFNQNHKNMEEICCVDTKCPLLLGYDNIKDVMSDLAGYIVNEWNLKLFGKKKKKSFNSTVDQRKFCQVFLKWLKGGNMYRLTDDFTGSFIGGSSLLLKGSCSSSSMKSSSSSTTKTTDGLMFSRKIRLDLIISEREKKRRKREEEEELRMVSEKFIGSIKEDEIMDELVKIKIVEMFEKKKEIVIPNKRCLEVFRKSISDEKKFYLQFPDISQLLDSFENAFQSYWFRNGEVRSCIFN